MHSCINQVSFFFQAEDGIRGYKVTGVQTCALPISIHAAESVSGRPAGSCRCGGQRASEAQRDEAGASATVWQLLVGMRVVAAVATGSFLVREAAAGAGKRRLASGARAVGGEPADRSWQRVPCAPAVVRSERDGRFAGAGFWSGGKRSVVPVSGSGAGSQARSVLAFTATLERSVRCGVRCAAV